MVDRTTPKYQRIGATAQVRFRARRRKEIHELKKISPCTYCGIVNPLCIDFDHIDRSSKLGTPATMITGGYAWKDVLTELKKCQPVCANCHRVKSILESGKMQALHDEDLSEWIPEKLRSQYIPPKVSMNSS